MKKSALVFTLLTAVLVIVAAGCGEKKETIENTPTFFASTNSDQAAESNVWRGEVLETMNSGGYTYVYIATDAEKIWAAGPEAEVAVGQVVTMDKGMKMSGFHAKSLDRTFEVIYFVSSIQGIDSAQTTGEAAQGGSDMTASPHGAGGGMGMSSGGSHSVVGKTEIMGIAKVAGGYTVEEIFTQGAALDGQSVKVRGQVVKFTANIMGTNWVHIQDGTGSAATSDLTVTTDAVLALGDVVVVEGPLTVNKDFGSGYKYAAIIQGATVTKE